MVGNLIILYFCLDNFELNLLEDFSKGFLIFQYFFLINEWGFNLYALENIKPNIKKINIQVINEIIFSKILIGMACFLLISLLLFFDIFSFNNSYMPFFLTFIIFSSALNPLWFFQAIGKIELLNSPYLFLRLAQIIIFYMFINILGVGLFFILQGIIFISLFLFNLHTLKHQYGYTMKINLSNCLLGLSGINKMKFYFLSNVHNHLNLTLWGIVLLVTSSPIQIIIFNLVDTIYRGINAIYQSIIEPIFREFELSLKNSIYATTFLAIFFILIYYSMPFLTNLFFPKYSNDLIDIFKLLSIVLATLFISKVFTYLYLGKNNIKLMNRFNIQFLFIEIILVFAWFLFMQNNVKEIIILLFFLNLGKIFLLTLGKLFTKNIKTPKTPKIS